MPHPFDSTTVRTWASLALEAVGDDREQIDAINVFPVADGDTGTNLYRTLDVAASTLRDLDAEGGDGPAAPALRALARGALLGACGNSGTILAQLLRGMAEVYGGADGERAGDGDAERTDDGGRLAAALRRAAQSAYEAVAHPVEGTMLTVARAAADAAGAAVEAAHATGGGPPPAPVAVAEAAVARAAHEGARAALSATTGQLDVLRNAGVVDAGGSGLVAVLGALADALTDPDPGTPPRRRTVMELPRPAEGRGPADERPTDDEPYEGPSYEVIYLLDADDAAVTALREWLDRLGDSLVVGGGDGLWSVHVHVDDAGAAVEAGIAAGRPHRVRITHLKPETDRGAPCGPAARHATETTETTARVRAVVSVVHGDGLAGLCEEAGAVVVRANPRDKAAVDSEALLAAVRATGATEVMLLPNDADLHVTAARAAEQARGPSVGVRVAVVPTRAAVQGIAALAVHEPGRRFDEDVVAMTAAAGATRYGEVTFAEYRSWTMAGICESGDVLGLVEGDVAVIGTDVTETAVDVLERMLAAGGEMVTLVLGEQAPTGLAARLEEQVRRGHLAVDTVVYEGRQHVAPLLIGVE